MLDEFFRVTMRETFYDSVDALQADLDAWLVHYSPTSATATRADAQSKPSDCSSVKKVKRTHERHLAFESWDALARLLTGKRMELLRYVRRHDVASIHALANALGRDYRNVHADVQALTAAGLLNATNGGLRADYNAILSRIVI